MKTLAPCFVLAQVALAFIKSVGHAPILPRAANLWIFLLQTCLIPEISNLVSQVSVPLCSASWLGHPLPPL
jgi:hypothetical protein